MVNVVVGVDESGTGAFAGSFHVGVVAAEVIPFNSAIGRYLKDSKKLSDKKRRKAVPLIQQHAAAWSVREVTLNSIRQGQDRAWRWAIVHAFMDVQAQLGGDPRTLIIDGPVDKLLRTMLHNITATPLRFEKSADDKYPAVMAAAILAKTARNDTMVALAAEYPEYGWDRNAGYGTPEHIEACRKYGVTKHHRPIKSLQGLPEYAPREEWFEGAEVSEAVEAGEA